MDLDILNTAGSALIAERLRMDVISSNIANINTTHDANGNYSPYRRKVLKFENILDEKTGLSKGIKAEGIVEDQSELKQIYDPANPNADEYGYVSYPNVTLEREMVDMATARASYEANVKTIQVFKSMFNAALEI